MMIFGEWIEIRYKRPDGSVGSKYVMVDSQGCFFWNPPEPVSAVYFRIHNREKNQFCVAVHGIRLWSPLWTPDEFANFQPMIIQPGGLVEGRVFEDPARRAPALDDFKFIEPIPFEFKKIEDDGTDSDKLPQDVLQKIRKNLAKQESDANHRKHSLLWRVFHPRKAARF